MATGKSKSAKKKKAKSGPHPLVSQTPQLKSKAAASNGMFLHEDDTWAKAYFAPGDLHNLERELFAKGVPS